MDFLTVIAGAITLGSTLGATIASLFAVKQKTRISLLEAIKEDYKERVDQLEKDQEHNRKLLADQAQEIKQLKAEKLIPLEKLTKLIIRQHTENQESIMALTKALTTALESKK